MVDHRPRRPHFPYAERAAATEAARQAVSDAFRSVTRRDDRDDPATAAWLVAIDRFNAALDAAYPSGFREDCDRRRTRDPAGLESAIAFLEADPWFFRSGYAKASLIRLIKRLPLTPEQVERLRVVVLDVVDQRDRREFRDYCRLARRLEGPELRMALMRRLAHADEGVRRRAGWMLDALGVPHPASS